MRVSHLRKGVKISCAIPVRTSKTVIAAIVRSMLHGEACDSLLYMPIKRVVWAFQFLKADSILESYIKHKFNVMHPDIRESLLLVECMVEAYGIQQCPEILWRSTLEAHGISKRWVLRVDSTEDKLNCATMLSRLVRDDNDWEKIWQNSFDWCIFCKINLKEMRNVEERKTLIHILKCCRLVSCIACYDHFRYSNPGPDPDHPDPKFCPFCERKYIYLYETQTFQWVHDPEYRRQFFTQAISHSPMPYIPHITRGFSVGDHQPSSHFHYNLEYAERQIHTYHHQHVRTMLDEPCEICGHEYEW